MNSSWERPGEPKHPAALRGLDSDSWGPDPDSWGLDSDSSHWPDHRPWDPDSPMDRSLDHRNRDKGSSRESNRSTDSIHRHRDTHIPKATQS